MKLSKEEESRLPEPGQPSGIKAKAVIVGYGPVGQTASRILKDFDIPLVIVDLNLDTIRSLRELGQAAIYGDASRRDILEAAGVRKAGYLLVTIPDVLTRTAVILAAKELNAGIHVFTRARYLQERAWLEEVGATDICIGEAETAIGLAILLLQEVGADGGRIQKRSEKSVKSSEFTGGLARSFNRDLWCRTWKRTKYGRPFCAGEAAPWRSKSSRWRSPRDEVLVRMVASGICHTDIDFCDINQAITDAKAGGTIKPVLRISEVHP